MQTLPAHKHIALLQVHHQPDRVAWLIEHLTKQDLFVVVHVDAKTVSLFKDCASQFSKIRNVHFLENTVDVNWSGFSQVRATLKGVNWVKRYIADFEYLHLMSGECLPLLPFKEIDEQLGNALKDRDLIDINRKPEYDWRINRYNLFGENKRNRNYYYIRVFKLVRDLQTHISPRDNFRVEDIYKGSQWWSLRKKTLDSMFDRNIDDFVDKFKWTRCADEHFFQILFSYTGFLSAGNHRYDDIQSNASAKLLDINELKRAVENGAFIARKVDLPTSKAWQQLRPA